eukprot:jgi/Galph1/2935/GphlegSOOS_G1598.1
MSGVNGGIDYSLDVSSFPLHVQKYISILQNGAQSPAELVEATRFIASYGDARLIPVLVDVLGFNNPVAAKVALDAIVSYGSSSMPYLLKATAAFNYSVNAYALKALARLGDVSVLEICLQCAYHGTVPNVRRAAVRSLGSLKYSDIERRSVVENLASFLCDSEWSVRYAAVVSMEKLSNSMENQDPIKDLLQSKLKETSVSDKDPVVRSRALLAVHRLEEYLLRES